MKMRIKKLREDEKGSGLVLTLMVLLVLSVLGIAIGTLAIGSYRLSNVTRDDTSAYYIAEAGAVAAYEEVQKEVLNAYKNNETKDSFYNNVSTILASKNGKSKINFETQFGSRPTATIKTEKVDLQNYTILSNGEVDGKERTVTKPITVNWVEKNTGGGLPEIPKNAALLAQNVIEIGEGGKLVGNMHINSTKKDSIEISGGPNLTGATLYYPSTTTVEHLLGGEKNEKLINNSVAREKDVDFKTYQSLLDQVKIPIYNSTDFKKLPDKTIQKDQSNQHKVQDNGNLFVNSWIFDSYKLEVKENLFFKTIEVGSQKTLKIDPMGGNHTIIVDNLSVLHGNLIVEGEGTITLVVTDKMKFGQPSKINEPGIINQLLLIYTGSSAEFKNINKMNANVMSIGNKGSVKISNTTINGIFLSDSSEISFSETHADGPSNIMLIAPKAEVTIKNGYEVNGTIVAKKFILKGGASLSYTDIKTTGSPFGSSGTTTDPKPEDIISSGIIKED